MSDVYPRINPKLVVVDRETRQRQENIKDVSDLKSSITQLREMAPDTGGYINPIVLRERDGQLVLVAGERRLTAALELDLPEIPYRSFADLPKREAEIMELEENVKRRELHWRDQVRAIGRIHDLYLEADKNWKVEQTGTAISMSTSRLFQILRVYKALNSGRIDKAESIDQAFNTLQKFSERKAEAIVSEMIVMGASIFGAPQAAEPTISNVSQPVPSAQDTSITTVSPLATFDEVEGLDEEGEVEGESTSEDLLGEVRLPPPAPTPPLAPTIVPVTSIAPAPAPSPLPQPVICAEFGEWVRNYNGPKFTLIHCDFPYGNYKGNDSKGAMGGLDTEDFYDNTESVYWNLVDILVKNLDRIMSYQAHLVFWFNMNFYTDTVKKFRQTGLIVHDHPIIWHKTGGPGGLGVAPGTDATHPRRTYDTALIGVRGNRPLVRSMCNSYAAPTAGNKIHPSQKPEPMLRYFLQMFVDETTTVFDPTCGSAAALRAAEELGARSVLGLEMDPNYAATANTKTLQARMLRQAGALMRESA